MDVSGVENKFGNFKSEPFDFSMELWIWHSAVDFSMLSTLRGFFGVMNVSFSWLLKFIAPVLSIFSGFIFGLFLLCLCLNLNFDR